jgi:hypothetical protein
MGGGGWLAQIEDEKPVSESFDSSVRNSIWRLANQGQVVARCALLLDAKRWRGI